MGRKLTEREKAERAAKADLRKQQKELGPLYAGQGVKPSAEELLIPRRLGWARDAEHLCTLLMGRVLDVVEEQALRREVASLVAPEALAELDERRACLPKDYGVDFWRRVLRDQFGRPYTLANCWRRCPTCRMWHAPGQTECLPPSAAEGPPLRLKK